MVNARLRGGDDPTCGLRSVLVLRASKEIAGAASSSGASAFLLRLGPCVETEAREAARRRALEFMKALREKKDRPLVFAEIAPLDAGQAAERDLAALVVDGLDGVFALGCDGRAALQQLSARLAVREAEADLPDGGVKIVALAAQTPSSFFALGRYAGASARLAGLAIDQTPLPGGLPAQAAARTLLALGAAAAGVPALAWAPKSQGPRREGGVERLLGEGFAGLMTDRPEEIAAINRAFGRS